MKGKAEGLRIVLGLAFMATALLIHFLYEVKRTALLAPLGIILFALGFYLSLSKIKFLKPFRSMLPFLIVAILAMWAFLTTGWDAYIVDSDYGILLTDLTIRLTVAVLNGAGINVVRDGGSLVFPSDSKVQSITIDARCSGAHSSIIFLVAFALMLVDVGRRASKRKLLVCFIIGGLGAYLAGMLRISLLGLIGHFFGYNALQVTHLYSGYLIFLALITAFWWLSLRWLLGKPAEAQSPRIASS